jgi:hypothetical protein
MGRTGLVLVKQLWQECEVEHVQLPGAWVPRFPGWRSLLEAILQTGEELSSKELQ